MSKWYYNQDSWHESIESASFLQNHTHSWSYYYLIDVNDILNVLPSRAVNGDASFNTTNYENRATIRPIYRVRSVQFYDITSTSYKECEWDLKKNVQKRPI